MQSLYLPSCWNKECSYQINLFSWLQAKKKFLFASPLVLSHRITEPESTIIKIPKTPTSSTLQQIFHPFNKQGIEFSIEVEELGLPGTS